MKKYKSILLTSAILISLTFAANAQPGGVDGFDDEPQDAPIDGGVSLLVGAGVAYGFKKIREHKKIKSQENN
ncbi:MAG: hypothetical protein SGJ00_13870 [bacterium]|nr:hypothetical protein [bacterium]